MNLIFIPQNQNLVNLNQVFRTLQLSTWDTPNFHTSKPTVSRTKPKYKCHNKNFSQCTPSDGSSDCIIGTKERVECLPSEIPYCPQECQRFKALWFETDKENPAQMKSKFSLDKGEILYGKILEQNVIFQEEGKNLKDLFWFLLFLSTC